jgi:hypothetical protein
MADLARDAVEPAFQEIVDLLGAAASEIGGERVAHDLRLVCAGLPGEVVERFAEGAVDIEVLPEFHGVTAPAAGRARCFR